MTLKDVHATADTCYVRRVTGVWACLLSGLLANLPLCLGAPKSSSGELSASGAPLAFTAYVGPGNTTGLRTLEGQLRYRVETASDYFDDRSWGGISDDQWDIDRWQGSGFRMTWAVPMLPATSGVTLAAGASGAYDRYFDALAKHLVAAGMGNSILRLGWEFNAPSHPWYAAGQAANFVAYWRQIVRTMRSVPGQSFRFAWNPNRGDDGAGNAAMGNLVSYYPGNAYVNLVGLDVYDVAWVKYPGPAAEFQDMKTQKWGLDWIASFSSAHDKAMYFPEVGLGWGVSAPNSGPVTGSGPLCGGDDPTFLTDMLEWAQSEHANGLVFWDSGKSSIERGKNPLTMHALIVALRLLSRTSPATSAPRSGRIPLSRRSGHRVPTRLSAATPRTFWRIAWIISHSETISDGR